MICHTQSTRHMPAMAAKRRHATCVDRSVNHEYRNRELPPYSTTTFCLPSP